MSKTITYETWKSMRQRCLNPENHFYKDYGGRGIGVCKEWDSFKQFVTDVGERPSLIHTIERRNNSLGYSKDNCYWATAVQQQNNKRSNVRICINGVTDTLASWCRNMGLNYQTIQGRIRDRGWNPEIALSKSIKSKRL